MGKYILSIFRTFSLFTGGQNQWFNFVFYFYLTKQLCCTTYGLETCFSYLGSIKHTYISMVKQTISIQGRAAIFFLFSFYLVGHNKEF